MIIDHFLGMRTILTSGNPLERVLAALTLSPAPELLGSTFTKLEANLDLLTPSLACALLMVA
jgi:hypothetical protein